jgi:pre-mRNA-splicing helicase BRR2
MASRGKRDLSGYNYSAIASLVITDRSQVPRRDKEPDGAPESLVGRINPKEMGSRVQREAPKDVDKKRKKAQAAREKPQAKREATGFRYTDIIEATQDVEGLIYRPRTAETRETYEHILSTVHQYLGDQAQDIIRSAADTVLETLKNENVKDFDKKKDIEDVVGPISNEVFSTLINLSKKITDYGGDNQAAVDPDIEKKDAEIDDELGVAVVFDEDEEEEDEEEGFEIREESDEEDEEGQKDAEGEDTPPDEDDELVLGGAGQTTARGKTKDALHLDPHDVDAFFIQRKLSEFYPDAVATSKASETMDVLGSESSLRDAENSLMDLFDWEHHDLVALFIRNRDVIVWCTKLARSDQNERVDVEVAMRERGVGWIIKALSGERKQRGAAGDAMDVDSVKQVPSTVTIAPGSTVQPQKLLDLESMAFAQGGHLMSNKKCKLPEGSFKRSKKGYEEIHIPLPKSPPSGSETRIPLSTLPAWARDAFGAATTTLNPVQSKVYPTAFGTDEPILLCAPTGAGKVKAYSPSIVALAD